jgi:hypothetical protein
MMEKIATSIMNNRANGTTGIGAPRALTINESLLPDVARKNHAFPEDMFQEIFERDRGLRVSADNLGPRPVLSVVAGVSEWSPAVTADSRRQSARWRL